MQNIHAPGLPLAPFQPIRVSAPAKREVRFDRLPEHVRQRFVAALSAPIEAPGSPIASESIGRTRARVTMVMLCALFLVLAYILALTWSSIVPGQGLIFAAICFPAVLILWTIVSRLARQNPFGALPFRPGRYLFALDWVDARGPTLVIRRFVHMRCVHTYVRRGGYVASTIVLMFEDGTKDGFEFRDQAMAEWALGKLNGVREQIAYAAARGDHATLAALDPFYGV
jgi:hypothetical protein